MKLESVTKIDKRNRKTSKTFDDDIISVNSDIIVIFFRFMTNVEQSGRRIPNAQSAKIYIFINNSLLSYKN